MSVAKEYSIHRWSPILNQPGTLVSKPALYITPDDVLLKLLVEKGDRLPIKITSTNSPYDLRLAYATFQPSETTAGFRPNFQVATGWIAVIPDIPWDGYPLTLGSVHVLIEEEQPSSETFLSAPQMSSFSLSPGEEPSSLLFIFCIALLTISMIVALAYIIAHV